MAGTATAVVLALLVTGLAQGSTRAEMLSSIVRGVATTVAGVIAAVLVLPFAERWTGRETHLTLLEWGDLNRPLLQRLSLEAPGTYAHTIAIANLAEAACRAIGANAVLARVGAYYHDIGKLARPQYFVENQPRGRNLHDKLKPSTSASIIRNHIREGLELAEAERVPASIRAFIAEHHGTATISFFLDKARDRDGAAATNVGEFTYPGPVPQSAETAIVMLADGAEAAARALHDPTPERIREVIELVVRQRLEQGQLRDAPLTLRQLTLVKEEFARVLGGMYHTRVEYRTPAPPVEAVPG
jgi:putative nucleotidyltransferase with HDIG domain